MRGPLDPKGHLPAPYLVNLLQIVEGRKEVRIVTVNKKCLAGGDTLCIKGEE
jgi:hypothetical protein